LNKKSLDITLKIIKGRNKIWNLHNIPKIINDRYSLVASPFLYFEYPRYSKIDPQINKAKTLEVME